MVTLLVVLFVLAVSLRDRDRIFEIELFLLVRNRMDQGGSWYFLVRRTVHHDRARSCASSPLKSTARIKAGGGRISGGVCEAPILDSDHW